MATGAGERRTAAWHLAGCLVALAAFGVAPAAAQEGDPGALDQEARALYEAGRVAFDDGRFEDALGHFERAYELSERPQLLYNMGSAADRLRQNRVALAHFEAYLEAVPEAHNRRSVEARIRVLREAVATDTEAPRPTTAPSPEETAAAGLDGASEAGAPPPGTEPPSRKGLWIGLGVAAAVLVGVGVVLAVVLAGGSDPDYQPSDEGLLVFTLERAP